MKKDIKPDILHIKKDANKELHYYSSHEERFSLPSAPKNRTQTKSHSKRNISTLIILVDIIVIVIVFVIVRIFFYSQKDHTQIAGYSLVLRSVTVDNTVIPSITVKKVDKQSAIQEGKIQIKFFIPDTKKEMYISHPLPQRFAEEIILRGSLAIEQGEKYCKAEVTIDNNKEILSIQFNNK